MTINTHANDFVYKIIQYSYILTLSPSYLYFFLMFLFYILFVLLNILPCTSNHSILFSYLTYRAYRPAYRIRLPCFCHSIKNSGNFVLSMMHLIQNWTEHVWTKDDSFLVSWWHSDRNMKSYLTLFKFCN